MSSKMEGPLRQEPSPAARDECAGGVQGEPMGKNCVQRTEGAAWSHSCPQHCFYCKGEQRPAQLLGNLHPALLPIYCHLLLPSQLTAACAPRNSTVPSAFCDLIWGILNVFFRWVGLVWFGLFSRTAHFLRGSN